MKYPLVSVVIPAYNAAAFIEETIASVLGQTYQNFEVLVVDDGSSDMTAAIVQQLVQQDSRIKLFQQPNSGVAAARNMAIQKARGDFIAPLDADDIWYPQNLEKQVNCFLQSDETVGLVYSRSVDLNEEGLPTGGFRAADTTGEVFLNLLCHNFIGNASATMIRRSCLEVVGLYNCQMREQDMGGCEDWDLYLRLAEHYRFSAVSEFLVGYRRCEGTMSRDYARMARSQQFMLAAVAQRHPEIHDRAYRFSQSSLYVYFAHLCNQAKEASKTLFWLKQAYKADCISPLIRLGFYQLLLINLWRLQFGSSKKSSVVQPMMTLAAVKQQRAKIASMLLVEKIFAYAVSIVFGKVSLLYLLDTEFQNDLTILVK